MSLKLFAIFIQQTPWDNLHKYVRRNVKRTLDERIERKRAQVKVEGIKDVDTDSDVDGNFKIDL